MWKDLEPFMMLEDALGHLFPLAGSAAIISAYVKAFFVECKGAVE